MRSLLLAANAGYERQCNRCTFDEFGMVVKSFMIGKKGIDKGDEFDDTKVEMKDAVDFLSSELQYEFLEWFQQTQSPGFDPAQYKSKPCYSKTHTRETHHYAHPLHESKFNDSYTYYDGGGKVVLTKHQAEPGKALQVNADGTVTTIPDTTHSLRWVGNGRTIFNNKGTSVKQYEPYFSTSPAYNDEKEMVELGVTVVMHYDPLGRNIRTDFPNKTFASVDFIPWTQKAFDANDNVKKFVWYLNLGSPDPAAPEPAVPDIRAAWLAAKHDNTPAISHLDSLDRTFLTVADNGTDKIESRIRYNIQGKELEVKDGMQRKIMEYHYNLLGNIVKQVSIDAGSRWTIVNAASKPLLSWDDRNNEFAFAYDDLNRLTTSNVKTGNESSLVFGKIEYGESLFLADAKTNNLRGVIHILYEQSGVTTNVRNDFKGNLLQGSRQLAANYKEIINWNDPATVSKEPEIFENSTEYDALNRPVKLITPHTAGMQPSEFFPIYNEAGMLNKMEVAVRGAGRTTFVTNINYNARGQRESIFYNNGTKTKYEYDKETFLLKRIFTTRNSDNKVLQDMNYLHDPAGNITEMNDASQAEVFFDGEQVKALNQYEYNALYQLVKATGRKHAGITDISHTKADFNYRNQPFVNSASINPNDAQAFRNYTEQYKYDKAGNMLEQKHVSKNSGWTRTFEYTHGNNQLSKTELGSFQRDYTYDAHGNLNAMEHLQQMVWNYMDHLSQVDLGGGGKAFYVYNSSGQRVRKVIERLDGTKTERIYFGAIEIYRVKNSAGTTVQERETLHIMDDNKTIAMVDTPVIKPAGSAEEGLIRYNYDNHLGSATIELDNNALQISYEEYFPFGTTSFSTLDATREVPAKRYRYTGKERDEETGLNYHGSRYYALWLCRWTAADPTGIKAGLNLYAYVNNNPIIKNDSTGNYEEAGHYFTTYLAKLAAGNTNQEAFEGAVHSQMPDEVSSLDATKSSVKFFLLAGFSIATIGAIAFTASASNSLAATSLVALVSTVSITETIIAAENVHTISGGLHALTGRGSKEEWEKRLQQVKDYKDDPAMQGMAVHALGDAVAHSTGEGDQYGAFLGHGSHPRIHEYGDRNGPLEFHEPDRIYNRPEMFGKYVHDLIGAYASDGKHKRVLSPEKEKEMITDLTQRLTALKGEKDDKTREAMEHKIFEEVIQKYFHVQISSFSPELHDDSTLGSYRAAINDALKEDKKKGVILNNPITSSMTERMMRQKAEKIYKDSR